MNIQTRTLNEEVLVARKPLVRVGRPDIRSLRRQARRNQRRRIRLCAHRSPAEALQEMFIVLERSAYIRPHKHLRKAESLHILEGRADLVIFNDAGKVIDVVRLGAYGSGRPFYHRMDRPLFHTLRIHSPYLAFHETTTGPFRRSATAYAPWSPESPDGPGGREFLARLDREVRRFR